MALYGIGTGQLCCSIECDVKPF